MQNDYFDILIKNIKDIMKERNITQTTLVKATGISQPQISKALNPDEKNQFTLEQVIKIADYLKVSVDSLLGRIQEETKETTNKEICKLIISLIQEGIVSLIDVSPTEIYFVEEPYYPEDDEFKMFPLGDYSKKKGPVNYKALYFSNYFQFEGWTDTDWEDFQMQYFNNGNLLDKNKEINDFLNYFLQLYKLLESKDMPREIFDQAISDRLDKLEY